MIEKENNNLNSIEKNSSNKNNKNKNKDWLKLKRNVKIQSKEAK